MDTPTSDPATSGSSSSSSSSSSASASSSSPKMRLLPQEYERALQIKRMVAQDDILLILPDFDYVQYALCTDDEPLEKIKARMFTMQCFREQYGIHNTTLEGVELFHAQWLKHPGMILDIEYAPTDTSFLNVTDLAAFYPSKVQTPQDWRAFMGSIYYCWECMLPDFECMRTGFSSIAECMDSGMHNFNAKVFRKMGNELHKCYPKNQKNSYFLHSPRVAEYILDIWKDILPKNVRESFHTTDELPGFEETRLCGLFETPTKEIAHQSLSIKVARFLVHRYHNRSSFSLDTAEVVDKL